VAFALPLGITARHLHTKESHSATFGHLLEINKLILSYLIIHCFLHNFLISLPSIRVQLVIILCHSHSCKKQLFDIKYFLISLPSIRVQLVIILCHSHPCKKQLFDIKYSTHKYSKCYGQVKVKLNMIFPRKRLTNRTFVNS
jgi:hypothetical protein